jgi:hypothetical protein
MEGGEGVGGIAVSKLAAQPKRFLNPVGFRNSWCILYKTKPNQLKKTVGFY